MTWQAVFAALRRAGCEDWVTDLQAQSEHWLVDHGDYCRWSAALSRLPPIHDLRADFESPAITLEGHCDASDTLRQALQGLMPWRKGPYQLADVFIDSEWRSDMKWNRVLPQLTPLQGRRILDIGCGNGYHCWRMLAQDPALVIGVEPSVLFNLQFQAIQHYLQREDIGLLPIGVESIPQDLNCFDSVFSMGVLYHRKSPIDHLFQLRGFLVEGGELCLETLVISGEAGRVLVPAERYARMRNVWFIPSTAELIGWMNRCGYVNVRLVDESVTGTDEQRVTDWMQFESLAQNLDPDNSNLTLEGHPAPRRAVVLANRP